MGMFQLTEFRLALGKGDVTHTSSATGQLGLHTPSSAAESDMCSVNNRDWVRAQEKGGKILEAMGTVAKDPGSEKW